MIVARNLSKTFGRVPALRRIDLDIHSGERVAVVGPNGAGKTTLLRILGTLSKPSGGSLDIAGHDVLREAHEVRGLIGVVAHQPFLYDDLTVSENLHFYARLYGVIDTASRIPELLRLVGLQARASERVRILSRGQQQRLAIARAILPNPSILLLDEADTGLDSDGRQVLESLLAPEADRTVLFTTHNREWAGTFATRTVTLEAGKVVSDTGASVL